MQSSSSIQAQEAPKTFTLSCQVTLLDADDEEGSASLPAAADDATNEDVRNSSKKRTASWCWHPGWTVVLGGFLLNLTFSSLNCGNIPVYISSYMRANVEEHYRYQEATWIHSETMMARGVTILLGGYLMKRMGPRRAACFGCSIAVIGMVMTGLSIRLYPFLVVFTYGISYGVGSGISYVVPLACSLKWFPENPGLVTGASLAGDTMGSMLFAAILQRVINPKNVPVHPSSGFFEDTEVLNRVPMVFFVLGGAYAILQIVGCALLRDPTHDEIQERHDLRKDTIRGSDNPRKTASGKPPFNSSMGTTCMYTWNGSIKPVGISRSHPLAAGTRATYCLHPSPDHIFEDTPNETDVSPLEAVQTGEFYALWITCLLSMQVVVCSHTLDAFVNLRKTTNAGPFVLIGPLTCVLNSITCIAWGALSDRYSYKRAMMAASGMLTILFFSYFAIHYMHSNPMYVAWKLVAFSSTRSLVALLPSAVYRTFGPAHFPINFGLVHTSWAVGQAIQSLLVDELHESFGALGVMTATAISTAGVFLITYFHYDADTNPAKIIRRLSCPNGLQGSFYNV